MSRASSVPRHKTYSKDLDSNQQKLPKIEKNTLSRKSDINNKDLKRDNSSILNKEIANAINNLDNDLNAKLNSNNEKAQEQINTIKNNYYEIKYLLHNKINTLEKNQQKVFDYLKKSIEKEKIKDDRNDVKYHNYFQNYREVNNLNNEKALNIIKEVPSMIQNKMDQIYQDEIEENRKQNRFLNELKNQLISQFKEQRRQDNIRHQNQINELRKLKEDEEKERLELLDKLKQQKHLNYSHINKHKTKKETRQYNNNPFNSHIPFNYLFYPINNGNLSSLSSSLDELIKVYLLKDIMNNPRQQSDYHRYSSSRYDSRYYYSKPNKYPKISHSYHNNSQDSFFKHKYNNKKKYDSNPKNEFEVIHSKNSFYNNNANKNYNNNYNNKITKNKSNTNNNIRFTTNFEKKSSEKRNENISNQNENKPIITNNQKSSEKKDTKSKKSEKNDTKSEKTEKTKKSEKKEKTVSKSLKESKNENSNKDKKTESHKSKAKSESKKDDKSEKSIEKSQKTNEKKESKSKTGSVSESSKKSGSKKNEKNSQNEDKKQKTDEAKEEKKENEKKSENEENEDEENEEDDEEKENDNEENENDEDDDDEEDEEDDDDDEG